MTRDVRIDGIEVLDLRSQAGPGDAGFFMAARAAGDTGWYGPVAENCCRYARTRLADAVAGAKVTDHRALARRLHASIGEHSSRDASWAVGAVDCAVWDLHGRLAGAPVAALLAEAPAEEVPAYASWLRLDITDPASAGVVRRAAGGGWLFTKWGLRRGPAGETEVSILVAAAERAAQAAGGKVALDALFTWNPELALAFARRIDPSVLRWLEDPLPSRHRHAYHRLAACGAVLAVGERLLVGDDPGALLAAARPAALTIDVVGCGGLTRAADLVTKAHAEGVPVYPHGRSLVPAVHLAAAFPDAVPAVEYQLQWEPRRQLLNADPWTPGNGWIAMPSAPGLRITPRSQ